MSPTVRAVDHLVDEQVKPSSQQRETGTFSLSLCAAVSAVSGSNQILLLVVPILVQYHEGAILVHESFLVFSQQIMTGFVDNNRVLGMRCNPPINFNVVPAELVRIERRLCSGVDL